MKDHYDFSKGERGKFYFGDKPYDIVIHVDSPRPGAQFEVFTSVDQKFHFRLVDKRGTIFTSEEGYGSQDDCISAISLIKQETLLAPTVFA
jgi:uncharacterized protein YegP (UPF0339 family)